MSLNRDDFQRLVANAVTAEQISVVLPVSGTTILLRKPNKEQVQRSFVAAGDDDDREMVAMVNLFRWCLVDDAGDPLPSSYAQARAWWTTLDDEDAVEAIEGIRTLVDPDDVDEDGDAPKGS